MVTALRRIVASLVRAQVVPFLLNILRWLLVAIPATWTNSWLSYVESKLALAYPRSGKVSCLLVSHVCRRLLNTLAGRSTYLAGTCFNSANETLKMFYDVSFPDPRLSPRRVGDFSRQGLILRNQ